MTSETVTNAFFHAGTWACLTVTGAREGLLVEVEDPGSAQPLSPVESDLESLGGRGLRIVAELATAWGTYPSARGKVYWFHLAKF
ncbi:hypothetical protein GCM10009547_46230 [Sporichthya brevicatena]|uniref:Histidine kinase/HSP90-like ATPase domain-containing protein n=1 Tax=Sporichthya brevicatena TaxID=171442 RepID=A0ABN1HCH2_9ACTN